ncbi:ligase-associated DNA damage response endonuclease PdeM [Pelobium sp.]|nr:ligase-associated DNA damage response endonuclease PdeM [Pelobium sp.]MDA9554675.1 ligase-associated DNA damage response endonuclease PdeM [Pelobium sp.]
MQPTGYPLSFNNEELVLLPSKAIWFPQYLTLLVSDTHLGKGAHFRKAGIPIPKALAQEELSLLSDLIDQFNPHQIIFLGDLFHSDINNDCTWFSLWREMHEGIKMILVKGNHDILPPAYYQKLKIEVVDDYLLGAFLLMHDLPKNNSNEYIISGHIHPGVSLTGKAKQQIIVPCFYFGASYGVLPAFGKFTGKAALNIKAQDQVFAIAGNKILKLHT